MYDVDTGARQRLMDSDPRASLSLSQNGEVFMREIEALDSEIWLLTFE